MSRSGTNSMYIALEKLGIGKCWHAFRFGDRPEDSKVWMDFLERKWPKSGNSADARSISAADFDSILGDFAAVTDIPPAVFWKEMLDAYPEAKVVLVERDVDAWYRSFEATIFSSSLSLQGRIAGHPWFAWFMDIYSVRVVNLCLLRYFAARNVQELRSKAKAGYIEHNKAVKRYCQQQSRPILEYKLGSGLRPLCDFLEVDAPLDMEFPKTNESRETVAMVRRGVSTLVTVATIKLLTISALGVAITSVVWAIWTKPELLRDWIKRLSFR